MENEQRTFWPYRTSWSLACVLILLAILLILFRVIRANWDFPGKDSETVVLIGILLVSLLPLLAAMIDVIIERGGILSFKYFNLDFSQALKIGMSGITIPTNIGIPSQVITDNNSEQILGMLRKATKCEAVIIDLEKGEAWWETRLMVLLAGATRNGKPGKIVFVATDSGVEDLFQGWSHPDELFQCLLKSNPQYSLSYHTAMAAARQWRMVEPAPGAPQVALPSWMQGLATIYPWMARDPSTGIPNEMFPEQLLAIELGNKIESQGPPKAISIARLDELFRPVLRKNSIDESWKPERQLSEFFADDASHIAVTNKGKYRTIVERLKVLSSIVKTMVEKK